MELIHIRGLSWKPDSENVLNGITADFRAGVFYGIIGPNGSGKTSLLRHIMRIMEPKEQVLHVNGTDIRSFKRKELAREMSWVPQNTSIDVSFTAYDIVMMGRTSYFKPFHRESTADRKIVREAMEMTNCWNFRDNTFHTLSGGEAQRVIAARAIAQDTPVIILDEPVSHLDIRHQKELMETMNTLNQEHDKTILAVLHDLNLAAQYCGELFLLHQGKIFARGTPETVLTPENLSKVYGIEFHRLTHPTTKGLYLIPK